jgi:Spore germination protein
MRRKLLIVLFILLSIFLGGCSQKNNKPSDGKTVDVYYIDSKSSGLATESYKLIGTKINDQIDELLYMLNKAPENMVYKSVLPSNIVQKYSFDNTGLTIDFASAYNMLSVIDEVLCRAVIVKTLSQLTGIEDIQFSVEGQPLKDSDGVVGPLTAEDFVDNTEPSTSYKVKLYFTNKDGAYLIEKMTEIKYTGAESLEELVINRLINGPTESNLYRTIPEGTKLLSVSKTDGICTVDFNKKFLDRVPNVKEEIVIYSIVNTLVELPEINKVQFTVEGEVQKAYWDHISLDGTFERKLGLDKNPD